MPNVEVHRPGSSREDPNVPGEIWWAFTATVDGQAGVVNAWFPAGTTEAVAASNFYTVLMDDPSFLSGVTSTGATGSGSSGGGSGGGGGGSSGGGGSPTAAGSGFGSGPIGKPDHKDDQKSKMKTANGT